MDAPRPWTNVRRTKLVDCRVFAVEQVDALSPKTGREHPFFAIQASDWTNIVPVTENGEIVLIRQWRHGSQSTTLEIPGGIVDPGETPAEAAARELREETGYEAGNVIEIGVVNPNPALFANRCFTFLAKDVRHVGEIRNSPSEETVVTRVPQEALPGLLRDGRIDHALVIAALHWYALYEAAASA